jgi:hypothetical protein
MSLLNADVESRPDALGEDTWDLYQAIEDSFGVDFGNYQALLEKSVRELADEIATRSTSAIGDRCLTSIAFYRLRRALQSLTGSPRESIRPGTLIDDLLPWSGRDRRWTSLEQQLGLTLPGLAVPGPLFVFALLAPAILLVSLKLRVFPAFTWGLLFSVWIFLSVLTIKSLSRFARRLPPTCRTVGGLTRVILARNYGTFAKSHGRASDKELL